MVDVTLSRSASGLSRMFEERNFKGIALTGAFGVVGAGVAAAISGVVDEITGIGVGETRADFAALGASSVLAMMLINRFAGPNMAGSLAIGPLFLIGVSIFGIIFGNKNVDAPPHFRNLVKNPVEKTNFASQPSRQVSKVPAGEPRIMGTETPVRSGGFR